MSLGGLAMGIGMLVDSSIVVLESIYRCREEGDSTRSAAIRGTTECAVGCGDRVDTDVDLRVFSQWYLSKVSPGRYSATLV